MWLAAAELVAIKGSVLTLRGLDALRGSLIIDLKPYLPRADAVPDARAPRVDSSTTEDLAGLQRRAQVTLAPH